MSSCFLQLQLHNQGCRSRSFHVGSLQLSSTTSRLGRWTTSHWGLLSRKCWAIPVVPFTNKSDHMLGHKLQKLMISGGGRSRNSFMMWLGGRPVEAPNTRVYPEFISTCCVSSVLRPNSEASRLSLTGSNSSGRKAEVTTTKTQPTRTLQIIIWSPHWGNTLSD